MTKNQPTPNDDAFIPKGVGRVDMFKQPVAFESAMREMMNQPKPPPDPPRGSLTEGRDIAAAFTELAREGLACTYLLLDRAVRQWFGRESHREHWHPYWQALTAERNGRIKGYMSDFGGTVYTVSLHRALRTWTAVVPRILTDEEANANDAREKEWGDFQDRNAEGLLADVAQVYRNHCKRQGIEDPDGSGLRKFRVEHFRLPDATDAQLLKHFQRNPLPAWYRNGSTSDQFQVDGPDVEGLPPGSEVSATLAEVSTEERHRRWITEFIAEVEMCAVRFADSAELNVELNRLIETIRSFEVGTGEGRVFVEHLRTTGTGSEVLSMMQHGKARLLRRLEQVRDDAVPTSMNNGTSTTKGIVWNGTLQQLAWVLRELAMKGWINAPTHQKGSSTRKAGSINASAFAKATAPHFGVSVSGLEHEFKDSVDTMSEDAVKGWAIPKRPE